MVCMTTLAGTALVRRKALHPQCPEPSNCKHLIEATASQQLVLLKWKWKVFLVLGPHPDRNCQQGDSDHPRWPIRDRLRL